LINSIKRYKGKIYNIFFLGSIQLTNMIIPFVIYTHIIKIIGVSYFGLLMFAQSLMSIFQIILDFGFNVVATREISIYRDNFLKRNEIITSVILLKVLLVIFSFLIFCILYLIYIKINHNFFVFLFTLISVIINNFIPIWFFQGVEKIAKISFLNFISKLIYLILVFHLINNKSDYILIPILNSLSLLLVLFLSWFFIKKEFNFYFIFNKSIFYYIFKSSIYIFISNIFVSLYNTSNSLILGIFTNDFYVGIYASMEKIILAIKSLYVPIFNGLFPWLSRVNEVQMNYIIKKLFVIMLLLGLFISLFFMIFSYDILHIIYHNKDITQYNYLFKIFSLIFLFAPLNMLYNMLFLNATKRYKLRMFIMGIVGFIHILIASFLVKIYLIQGIIYASVFTEFLLLIFGIIIFIKRSYFK